MENTIHIKNLSPSFQELCITVSESLEPANYGYYSKWLKKYIETFKVYVFHDKIAIIDLFEADTSNNKSIIDFGD